MKKFFKIFSILVAVILLSLTFLYTFNYDYLLKGIRVTYLSGHTTAFIDDYPNFDNRIIEAAKNKKRWPQASAYNLVAPTQKLQQTNKKLGTAAFLIIKNDSIWYEQYFNTYGPNSKTNSFSMAKSIVSALLGKAIKQGYIKSLNQPVADFFPHFDTRLTVGDLSSMASGLNWKEDYYNPFGQTARAYFDENIRKPILNLKVINTPGKEFNYLSGNVELLAMVLEKATGQKLSNYLSDNFWKPMGMQNSALWQLDSRESGMEKAYCCIASNARDFARFGKLYSHFGNWEGRQILDTSFVKKSVQPRFKESPQYGYGFWLSNFMEKHIFYMRGILGQYVIAIPEDHLIIVRLGDKVMPRKKGQNHAPDFYIYIAEAYKMLNKTGA